MLIVTFVIIKACFKLINFRYSKSTHADLSSDTSYRHIAVERAKNCPKDSAGKKSLSQSMRFTGTWVNRKYDNFIEVPIFKQCSSLPIIYH